MLTKAVTTQWEGSDVSESRPKHSDQTNARPIKNTLKATHFCVITCERAGCQVLGYECGIHEKKHTHKKTKESFALCHSLHTGLTL